MRYLRMFEPKKISDLVGNPTALKKLEEQIKDGIPTLIVGPSGVGKTSGVNVIAKVLGYEVMSLNASDDRQAGTDDEPSELRRLLWKSKMDSPFGEKFLIFLDEVDGMGKQDMDGVSCWDVVKDIIQDSVYPVVLACNDDFKVPDGVQKLLIKIDFRQVDSRTVTKVVQKFAKDLGVTPDLSKVGGDIRSGISLLFGGEGYIPSGDFLYIQKFFAEGTEIEREKYPWILDNIPEFYKGYDMYLAYKILSLTRYSPRALDMLRKGKIGRVKYPTYYLVRKKDKKQEKTEDGQT
jgi:energy-coupling factor transporter ATP-binding protein EcfA2